MNFTKNVKQNFTKIIPVRAKLFLAELACRIGCLCLSVCLHKLKNKRANC